jgi:hypothetical protein
MNQKKYELIKLTMDFKTPINIRTTQLKFGRVVDFGISKKQVEKSEEKKELLHHAP